MSSNDRHTDAPLSEAELDMLDALNAARTPGPLTVHVLGPFDAQVRSAQGINLMSATPAYARAIVAALNALPLLLAEVRQARKASK